MTDFLYIIIPAYNESETIEQLTKDWHQVACGVSEASRLVVIDDGSTDDTYQILSACAKTMPQLVVLKKENGGHGQTLQFGYDYALKNQANYIFQTDADGQTSVEDFTTFWKNREKYDLLIGAREKREDGLGRVMVAKILKLVIRLCFQIKVKDANTPYRLMKRQALQEEMAYVPKNFFLTNALLTVLFTKHNRSVLYLPIHFHKRQGGASSINWKNTFKIGLRAIKDFRKLQKEI